MKGLEEANKILGIENSQTKVQEDFSYLKRTMWTKGVGAVQHGRSEISDYSFGISLQIIIQAVSTITICYAVGSLIYAIICTGADLAYAVSTLSQFVSNSGKKYW